MKQINVISNNGITTVKVGKAKEIKGEKWGVAYVPTTYMNNEEVYVIKRVVHISTGTTLPIKGMPRNAPIKDYLTEANYFLAKISEKELKKELAKFKSINQ